jgi:hypothetical protein
VISSNGGVSVPTFIASPDGVSPVAFAREMQVKRVDSDYFGEE